MRTGQLANVFAEQEMEAHGLELYPTTRDARDTGPVLLERQQAQPACIARKIGVC